MKKSNLFLISLFAAALFLGSFGLAQAAVCVNCESIDKPTLQMKNRTQNINAWVTGSLSASHNDNLGFLVYYRNSGATAGLNGKVRVVFPKNSQSSPLSVRGEVDWDGGGPKTGYGSVIFSGSQAAKLVFESQARFYKNSATNYTLVPVTVLESGNERIVEIDVGTLDALCEDQSQVYFFANLIQDQQINLPTVDIKANGSDGPVSLSALANYTLTWTSANATSCSASNSWSGSKSTYGSEAYSSMSNGSYTYSISCSNANGSASDSVIVNVSQSNLYPTVDLKVNGSDSSISLNSPAYYTLSWTSANAQTCYASNYWSGSKNLSGSESQSNIGNGTYTYSISCSNSYGSASDSVIVYVGSTNYQSSLSLSKLARDPNITVSNVYYETLYLIPGREAEFSLTIANGYSYQAINVFLQEFLPSGLIYVSGSTMVDGIVSSDSLTTSGLYLGTLFSGQTKVVKFRARLQDNSYFSQSLTQLTNTASVRADNASQVQDTAIVYAVKQGQVLGAATVDPGADSTTLAVILTGLSSALSLSGFQISRRIYWKKRIREARIS